MGFKVPPAQSGIVSLLGTHHLLHTFHLGQVELGVFSGILPDQEARGHPGQQVDGLQLWGNVPMAVWNQNKHWDIKKSR